MSLAVAEEEEIRAPQYAALWTGVVRIFILRVNLSSKESLLFFLIIFHDDDKPAPETSLG